MTNPGECENLTTFPTLHAVTGSIGAVLCIVALIIVLVSRFYKDIVQRLIVYKLIAMLVFSLSQLLYETNLVAYANLLLYIVYCVNLVMTLWLTIILYLCIVHLKKLKNLKKLEPVAIITSYIPLIIVFFTDKGCRPRWIKFSEKAENNLMYLILTLYSIVGLISFIISILMIIIFIRVLTRSFRRQQNDNQAESQLLTNQNKWRTLSKQLLPLVVYPIVNTIVIMIFFPLAPIKFILRLNDNKPLHVLADTLQASLGLITSTVVILHFCILKCKKKRRKKQSILNPVALVTNRSDVFTSYTIASTNARTEYRYDRKSTITSQM